MPVRRFGGPACTSRMATHRLVAAVLTSRPSVCGWSRGPGLDRGESRSAGGGQVWGAVRSRGPGWITIRNEDTG